jgi:hypothetical protein
MNLPPPQLQEELMAEVRSVPLAVIINSGRFYAVSAIALIVKNVNPYWCKAFRSIIFEFIIARTLSRSSGEIKS